MCNWSNVTKTKEIELSINCWKVAFYEWIFFTQLTCHSLDLSPFWLSKNISAKHTDVWNLSKKKIVSLWIYRENIVRLVILNVKIVSLPNDWFHQKSYRISCCQSSLQRAHFRLFVSNWYNFPHSLRLNFLPISAFNEFQYEFRWLFGQLHVSWRNPLITSFTLQNMFAINWFYSCVTWIYHEF